MLDGYWTLWDWRRRVAELYAEVRGTADAEAAWRHWRRERDRLFACHDQSPLGPVERAGFAANDFFDYRPDLRFTVAVVPGEGPAVPLPAGADGEVQARPFARTEGLEPRLGRELTLYWLEGYGGGVFLPFRDGTSGSATYGGGRYLLDTIKGADLGWTPDGRLILDFNFAYNPSCSYSARWVCPLAPAANALSAPVEAGERVPRLATAAE